MSSQSTNEVQSQIANHLYASKHLVVSQAWLASFVASQRTINVPVSALTQTALFRLLASDITTSLSKSVPSAIFPADITDPNVRERKLPGPIAVQIVDIDDIGSSRWTQVEAIERVERGEETRGREVIRTITREDEGTVSGSGNGSVSSGQAHRGEAAASNGPLKLLLQDANGTKAHGFELEIMQALRGPQVNIGTKLVLKEVVVARGLILLKSDSLVVLGGKIETLDKDWKEARKTKLLSRIG